MKPTLIKLHLGLGDAILCAPIVGKFATENPNKNYVVPCYAHNLISVKDIFSPLPNVSVEVIESVEEYSTRQSPKQINLGYYGPTPRRKDECFISWFYRHAQMNLSDRDKYCPIRNRFENIPQGNIVFVHDKPEHKIEYHRIELEGFETVVSPQGSGSILKFADRIISASQIHCIDSAFLHLADALPTTGKLFFHRYARAGEHNKNLQLRKNWEVIE